MARKLRPDWVLFIIALTLVIFGVVMVFSSSAAMAMWKYENPNYFSFKQIMAAVFGLALMFIIMKVDYHLYRKPAVVFSVLSMSVAMLVVVYFLSTNRNTHRWIQISPFSFQPSELAKLALIFFLAYFLEKRKEQINNFQFTLAPVAIIVGLVSILIAYEPDLGTAIALLLTVCVLVFVAGVDLKWFAAPIALSVPVFYFMVYLVPWRWDRIIAFLHPEFDPLGDNYQINQSLVSVGSGGVFGLGYMEGRHKVFFLPDAHTDFIFAVVGEELGLIGACAVLLMFLVFLWRGLRTSAKAPDRFGFYLALGITTMVCVQAFINMSVVLALVPTKGIPLPFLSYGGSSFVVMLAAVGILLNVSQQSSDA
jgi:cell division protein FtsW